VWWAGPAGHKQLGTKEKHGIKKIPGKKIRGNGGNKFQGGKNRDGKGKKCPAHALARCARDGVPGLFAVQNQNFKLA